MGQIFKPSVPLPPAAFANPSVLVGLVAKNGIALTAMRSDAAPGLDQGIIPTWTGVHTYSALSNFYPASALETATGTVPVRPYVYGDPRRAPLYPSAGWTDFGDVPTFIDANHVSVPGDQTARYLPLARILLIYAAGNANVVITARVFAAGITTITFTNDSGDAVQNPPLAIWTLTGLPANGPGSTIFNKNAILGIAINNLSTGILSAARFAAFTSDAAGVADSAMSMVSVSPNFSTPYLGGGWPTGQPRGVLYTPVGPIEIGTSDVARILIHTTGAYVEFRPPIYSSAGSAAAPGVSFITVPDAGLFTIAANELRMGIGGVARQIWGATYNIDRVQALGANGSLAAPQWSYENSAGTGWFRQAADVHSAVAGGVEIIRVSAARATFFRPFQSQAFTVATLPAGAQGDRAHVTDALAPAFGAAVAGGGAVVIPVFFNGAAWIVG